MNSKICLINYGAGNMASIRNALNFLDIEYIELFSGPLPDPSKYIFILPGVGSFYNASLSLKNRGFDFHLLSAPRVIGICLGMQLLFSDSTEGSLCEGLSFIPGSVRAISSQLASNPSVRLPHVGWQTLSSNFCHPAFASTSLLNHDFYFVHSYMAVNVPNSNVIAYVRYGGIEIPAIVAHKRVIGFQFHPEKSGHNGLFFLQRFVHYLASL
jgi:glutamine amidotransferase